MIAQCSWLDLRNPASDAPREVAGGGAGGGRDQTVKLSHAIRGLPHHGSLGIVLRTKVCAAMPEPFNLGIRGVCPTTIASFDRHRQNRSFEVFDLNGEAPALPAVVALIRRHRRRSQRARSHTQQECGQDARRPR
jgi:hypothetical protein